jgi:putative nucleotidyltransferase with HDIG domain
MSRAVGEREGESEIHCGEVSHLAGAVAVELGLGATVRLRCRVAGMLHDIGKIGIPEHILRKPGRFTPEERLVMQRHAAFGAEIVARVPSLADTAPAVRHHHERWDGGGYPDGIAGAAIPVEARIIAAVDTWSAMRERRVYADARTHDAAVEELRASAGSQLDPAVVRALLAVIERHDGPALRRDVAA